MKYLVGTALAVLLVTPAAAQEFWIVQDTATKRCTVVEQRPSTTTTTRVMGDGRTYKTLVEAEGAVKEVCTDGTTGTTTPPAERIR
jgi:hypothetical protein